MLFIVFLTRITASSTFPSFRTSSRTFSMVFVVSSHQSRRTVSIPFTFIFSFMPCAVFSWIRRAYRFLARNIARLAKESKTSSIGLTRESVTISAILFPTSCASSNVITFDEAQLVGNSIADIVTDSLVKPMELVFDSFARRAIFLAKKRYALLIQEKTAQGIKEKIKVKGMETVRRDWCELTTKTIEKVLELVLKEGKVDDAVILVKNTINSIKTIDATSPLFEDLILTRQYTKKIESYRNRQPHITVIEKLRKRGIISNVGDRIPFVIVAGNAIFVDRAEDPEYAQKKNLPIDVDYYINKQILPPVERILSDF